MTNSRNHAGRYEESAAVSVRFAQKSEKLDFREAVCGELLILKQNQQFATDRLDAAPSRSCKARDNHSPTAILMRSLPYHARASPRPRSRANQDVTFRADQVLRSHSRRDRSRRESRDIAERHARSDPSVAMAMIFRWNLSVANC